MRKLFFLLILFSSCSKPQAPLSNKPIVLVSIPPYQTLVQKIGGDAFEVQTIVPTNADPHTYEPTSQQISQMLQGDLWIRIGESFEKKILPMLKKTKSIDLCQNLSLIEGCGHCQNLDRHVWLSPKLLLLQADKIAAALSDQFPQEQERIQIRLKKVTQELHALDQKVEQYLHSVQNRTFLISHPAFAYFCKDYDCEQIPVEQEGKEPRPKELEAILHAALSRCIALAITLPQHNNKGTELIAKKLRIPIQTIDPYSKDYEKTIESIAFMIKHPDAQ